MPAIDLLFLVVIFLSAWGGWRSGFVYAAIGLMDARPGGLDFACCVEQTPWDRTWIDQWPGCRIDPFDRMRAAHIRFLTAGENLALAQTMSIAHTGLMHSPGHRANILDPAFHRVGIGIVEGGVHGLMNSQEFKN